MRRSAVQRLRRRPVRLRHVPGPVEPERIFYVGIVYQHGYEWTPEEAQWNAIQIMEGFDELPKRVRDLINYAETPHDGARATPEIVEDLIARTLRARGIKRNPTT